jgi:hypothetical protein
MKRKTLRLLFVAAVAALGLCRVAQSTLRVDLRVTSVSGPATTRDAQSVLVTNVGAQIHMDIWAHITGTNAQTFDEALTSLTGSLVSAQEYGPYVQGTLTTSLMPNFSALGSSIGMQTDLDADGDLDVGSNNDSNSDDFFAVRALSAPNPIAGPEIRIGQATFTIDSITSSFAGSFLYFRPRRHDVAATWFEDGIYKRPDVPGALFVGGYAVAVSAIPEPGPLALLAAVATFASALRPQRRK